VLRFEKHLLSSSCGLLAENGTVQIPIQKTFWAVRYGGLVDQFGIPWEINCEEAQ
jgi:PhnB protein